MESMLTVTSMADDKPVTIPLCMIKTFEGFVLNGKEHCFINLDNGRQIKAWESIKEIRGC